MEKITKYRSENGKDYDTSEEALLEEAVFDLTQWILDNQESKARLRMALITNIETIQDIVLRIKQYSGKIKEEAGKRQGRQPEQDLIEMKGLCVDHRIHGRISHECYAMTTETIERFWNLGATHGDTVVHDSREKFLEEISKL